MRNPLRSETAAFRFLLGTIVYFALIVLATALGGAWWGLGIFLLETTAVGWWWWRGDR